MAKTEFDKVKGEGEPVTGFSTGAVRSDASGKGSWHLVPYWGLLRVAVHYENGSRRYKSRNWEQGMPSARFIDSAMRHIFQLAGGDESEDHAAAVAWNMLCLMHQQKMIELGKLPANLAYSPVDHFNRGTPPVTFPSDVATPGSPEERLAAADAAVAQAQSMLDKALASREALLGKR